MSSEEGLEKTGYRRVTLRSRLHPEDEPLVFTVSPEGDLAPPLLQTYEVVEDVYVPGEDEVVSWADRLVAERPKAEC